jgi:hypothetical protein
MSESARDHRLAAVVCGVLRQALADAGAAAVTLCETDSPEALLLRGWIERELGAGTLARPGTERTLVADPANKTALLLDGAVRGAPLLPLGDVYASHVERLTGAWSGGRGTRSLAAQCGGIDALDAALRGYFERRCPATVAFAGLVPSARAALIAALEASRFARRRVGLVAKLGERTLGIDLFA